MSSEPKIGGREPVLVELVAGETCWWCRCGRSQTQPFCDGSHEGSGIEPLEWQVERNRRALLCTCKRTKTPPICDDSHLKLWFLKLVLPSPQGGRETRSAQTDV